MRSVVTIHQTLSQKPVTAFECLGAHELPIFVQKVPAGFPSPAQDYTQETLDIHQYLVQHQAASFFFTVVGQSMTGAHIEDGDKVLVDRSVPPRHNHIVIASVNGEYTIKRLYKRAGVIELRPENPAFQPIRFSDGEELVIWGVVIGVVRKLRV